MLKRPNKVWSLRELKTKNSWMFCQIQLRLFDTETEKQRHLYIRMKHPNLPIAIINCPRTNVYWQRNGQKTKNEKTMKRQRTV